MKKGFWKAYLELFKYCYYNNGKILTILIFLNPYIIWSMFVYYINVKKRYDYVN